MNERSTSAFSARRSCVRPACALNRATFRPKTRRARTPEQWQPHAHWSAAYLRLSPSQQKRGSIGLPPSHLRIVGKPIMDGIFLFFGAGTVILLLLLTAALNYIDRPGSQRFLNFGGSYDPLKVD